MIIALLSLQAMTVSSWIECHCCLLEIGALVKPPLSSQLNRHAVRDVEFSKRTSRSIRLLISKCQSCRVFGLFGDFGQFDEQHNDGEFDSDNDKSISSEENPARQISMLHTTLGTIYCMQTTTFSCFLSGQYMLRDENIGFQFR